MGTQYKHIESIAVYIVAANVHRTTTCLVQWLLHQQNQLFALWWTEFSGLNYFFFSSIFNMKAKFHRHSIAWFNRISFIDRYIWLNTIVMCDSSPMARFWWWHQPMNRPTLLVNFNMANTVRMCSKAAISKHWCVQMANNEGKLTGNSISFSLFNFAAIRFLDDIVTVIVRKNKTGREERMRAFTDYERQQPTFYLQFLMSYTRKRRIPQLEWKKYSVSCQKPFIEKFIQ